MIILENNSIKTPHTILLAEDNPDDVLLAQIAFERAGLTTSKLMVVPNGEEAVRYLEGAGVYADRLQFPFPQLILLDLHMPKGNGFDVLDRLREWPGLKPLPVVILADTSDHEDLTRCFQLGADSVIDKPTDTFNFTLAFRKLADRWLFGHGRKAPVLSD